MTISNVKMKAEMGASGAEATFVELIRFNGPSDYKDGGLDENALLQAAVGKAVTPIAMVKVRTVGAEPLYRPAITLTPAILDSAATAWPVADQDGKTLKYKLNGGDEQTLTLAGAHTTAAQLAASIEAISGLHAYVESGGQVRVKTTINGSDASFQITGGTANAVYLFPTDEVTGSDNPLLLIIDDATGLDVGDGDDAGIDLSAELYEAVLFAE